MEKISLLKQKLPIFWGHLRLTKRKLILTALTFFLLSLVLPPLQVLNAQDLNNLPVVTATSNATLPIGVPMTEVSGIVQTISAIDARARLIDDLYLRYRTPMKGLGQLIVENADKFGLPFNLLPAISFCESQGGKVMPEGSFNAWGWYIYGDNKKYFESWEEAVETISAGLKKNYINKGLTTPEEIMTRYTPSSNGSWAHCVTEYMDRMK